MLGFGFWLFDTSTCQLRKWKTEWFLKLSVGLFGWVMTRNLTPFSQFLSDNVSGGAVHTPQGQFTAFYHLSLRWRHNEHDSVSNHQPRDCLLNGLFRRISKKTSKLRVTGLCVGEFTGTGEFPAQRASYAENASHYSISPPKYEMTG